MSIHLVPGTIFTPHLSRGLKTFTMDGPSQFGQMLPAQFAPLLPGLATYLTFGTLSLNGIGDSSATLKELRVSNMPIAATHNLSLMTNLKSLHLDHCSTAVVLYPEEPMEAPGHMPGPLPHQLSQLSPLTRLTSLSLNKQQVDTTVFDRLAGLFKLRHLALGSISARTDKPLQQVTSLELTGPLHLEVASKESEAAIKGSARKLLPLLERLACSDSSSLGLCLRRHQRLGSLQVTFNSNVAPQHASWGSQHLSEIPGLHHIKLLGLRTSNLGPLIANLAACGSLCTCHLHIASFFSFNMYHIDTLEQLARLRISACSASLQGLHIECGLGWEGLSLQQLCALLLHSPATHAVKTTGSAGTPPRPGSNTSSGRNGSNGNHGSHGGGSQVFSSLLPALLASGRCQLPLDWRCRQAIVELQTARRVASEGGTWEDTQRWSWGLQADAAAAAPSNSAALQALQELLTAESIILPSNYHMDSANHIWDAAWELLAAVPGLRHLELGSISAQTIRPLQHVTSLRLSGELHLQVASWHQGAAAVEGTVSLLLPELQQLQCQGWKSRFILASGFTASLRGHQHLSSLHVTFTGNEYEQQADWDQQHLSSCPSLHDVKLLGVRTSKPGRLLSGLAAGHTLGSLHLHFARIINGAEDYGMLTANAQNSNTARLHEELQTLQRAACSNSLKQVHIECDEGCTGLTLDQLRSLLTSPASSGLGSRAGDGHRLLGSMGSSSGIGRFGRSSSIIQVASDPLPGMLASSKCCLPLDHACREVLARFKAARQAASSLDAWRQPAATPAPTTAAEIYQAAVRDLRSIRAAESITLPHDISSSGDWELLAAVPGLRHLALGSVRVKTDTPLRGVTSLELSGELHLQLASKEGTDGITGCASKLLPLLEQLTCSNQTAISGRASNGSSSNSNSSLAACLRGHQHLRSLHVTCPSSTQQQAGPGAQHKTAVWVGEHLQTIPHLQRVKLLGVSTAKDGRLLPDLAACSSLQALHLQVAELGKKSPAEKSAGFTLLGVWSQLMEPYERVLYNSSHMRHMRALAAAACNGALEHLHIEYSQDSEGLTLEQLLVLLRAYPEELKIQQLIQELQRITAGTNSSSGNSSGGNQAVDLAALLASGRCQLPLDRYCRTTLLELQAAMQEGRAGGSWKRFLSHKWRQQGSSTTGGSSSSSSSSDALNFLRELLSVDTIILPDDYEIASGYHGLRSVPWELLAALPNLHHLRLGSIRLSGATGSLAPLKALRSLRLKGSLQLLETGTGSGTWVQDVSMALKQVLPALQRLDSSYVMWDWQCMCQGLEGHESLQHLGITITATSSAPAAALTGSSERAKLETWAQSFHVPGMEEYGQLPIPSLPGLQCMRFRAQVPVQNPDTIIAALAQHSSELKELSVTLESATAPPPPWPSAWRYAARNPDAPFTPCLTFTHGGLQLLRGFQHLRDLCLDVGRVQSFSLEAVAGLVLARGGLPAFDSVKLPVAELASCAVLHAASPPPELEPEPAASAAGSAPMVATAGQQVPSEAAAAQQAAQHPLIELALLAQQAELRLPGITIGSQALLMLAPLHGLRLLQAGRISAAVPSSTVLPLTSLSLEGGIELQPAAGSGQATGTTSGALASLMPHLRSLHCAPASLKHLLLLLGSHSCLEDLTADLTAAKPAKSWPGRGRQQQFGALASLRRVSLQGLVIYSDADGLLADLARCPALEKVQITQCCRPKGLGPGAVVHRLGLGGKFSRAGLDVLAQGACKASLRVVVLSTGGRYQLAAASGGGQADELCVTEVLS